MIAALLMTAAGWMTSCSTDELDVTQHGVITVDEYKTADNDGVLALISAIYANLHGDASIARGIAGYNGEISYRLMAVKLGDMCDESAEEYRYTDGSEGETYRQVWEYLYRNCYWCNMLIENLPANEVCSASVKSQVLAEARVIRAISMMYLVQLYGNPPLADHVMEGNEGNTPAAESWEFIETELQEAAQDLPSKSGLGGQSAIGGRLTKEAAYAYLGKAQLWEDKYSDAAQTLYNHVIATGLYALASDFDQLNSSANDFSDENVFEFDFNDDSENASNQEGCFDVSYFAVFNTWTSKYANPMFVYSYGGNPSQSFFDFMKAHDGEDSPRYQGTLTEIYDLEQQNMLSSVRYPRNNCIGAINVKYLCRASDLVGTMPLQYNKANWAYMRYAEVLLNYAEAVAMGGTQGTLSGLEALNMVRRRAGLSDAPSLDMNNETYGVKAERRAELFEEGSRWIDLVRWGDAATVLSNQGKHAYSLQSSNGKGDYTVLSTETSGPGFVSGKNELFPIPLSDLNENKNLTQNPNW